MNKIFLIIVSLTLLAACTYSITQVHTQGTATDVVDEIPAQMPNINADISVVPK